MHIKKILIAGLFACGIALYGSDFKNPFVTGIDVIDTVEIQKFQEYQKKVQELYVELSNNDQFRQRLMGKIMVVFMTVSQEISPDEIKTKEDVCKCIRLVCQTIRNDADYTGFIQKIVSFCEDNLCNFVVNYYDSIKECYAAHQMQGFSLMQFFGLFTDYIPQDVDAVQVYVDWRKWEQEYCMQQIERKGTLSFDDMLYTATVFGEMLQLPASTMQVWSDFLAALHKGFVTLSETVQEKLLQITTQDIKDSVAHNEIQKMEQVLAKRKDLMQRSNFSVEILKEYEQLLDDMIVIKWAVDKIRKIEMYALQEKIIFKN